MLKVGVFTGGLLDGYRTDVDLLVGVDRGALFLAEHDLSMTLAIGDFDSVTADELARIRTAADEVIVAPAEKDDTDTELALKTIFERFPQAHVTVFGAFGGRLDHSLSNLFLPTEPALAPFMTQLCLEDGQNTVRYRPAGTHRIFPEADKTYVAFMSESDLTITGAKYDLSASNFFKKKIYGSNEFLDDQPITVTAPTDYLVIIQSKDRR